MLTIIFAKTALLDPVQLIGPLPTPNMAVKRIKPYGQINRDTLFAALIESPDGKLPPQLSNTFDILKVHPARLRKPSETPHHSEPKAPCRLCRQRRRHLQRERKCTLSESTWTRFVKRKHIIHAYQQNPY